MRVHGTILIARKEKLKICFFKKISPQKEEIFELKKEQAFCKYLYVYKKMYLKTHKLAKWCACTNKTVNKTQ